MKAARARLIRVLVAASMVMLGGCASSREMQIVFHPRPEMNGERSCYVLLRVVDPKAFGAETYDTIAGLVTKPDGTVKEAVVVLPGKRKTVNVRWSEQGRIAIQAMMLKPDKDAWRVLLPDPPPAVVEVQLEERRVCRMENRRRGECWEMGLLQEQ